MSSKHLWIAAVACTGLTGCNTMHSHYGDEDSAFGEAVKYDTAIQVINPAPVYTAASARPGANGDVGASAVKRYRTDKVKPVQRIGTSIGAGGGGGGGGGAGTSSGSGPQ